VNSQYQYDDSGNRLEAIRNGVTTCYIYGASGNLLAEADANGDIQQYYIYGAGLLAMATSDNSLYSYHFDATGHTVAMTDINKNIVNKYAYSPFGTIGDQEEAVAQPFKFVGQFGVMTESNGWYYMRARYYDPSVGRFISEDPIGFDGGDVNLYGYVLNNPVHFVDPLGLWTLQLGFGFNVGGLVGSSKSVGIIFGRNSKTKKWQFGLYAAGAAGLQGGAAASATVDMTWSRNDNITDVAGLATSAGGSGGIGPLEIGGEVNTSLTNAKPSYTFSLGVGTPGAEGHGFTSYTHVWK